MKSTFRILFYLKKNEPKKDGTVTIMARITVDGETKQFSTKKTILPEDWDIKSGRAVNKSGKITSAKISKLNKELDDLRGQISIQYTKQLNNNGYVGKSSVSCPLKPSDSAPLKHSTMPP